MQFMVVKGLNAQYSAQKRVYLALRVTSLLYTIAESFSSAVWDSNAPPGHQTVSRAERRTE